MTDIPIPPMEIPECPAGHGKTMEVRPLEKQTYEQKFCGTWFDCTVPGCICSVLFESKELLDHLSNQGVRGKMQKYETEGYWNKLLEPYGINVWGEKI
ncbi:hypothetical protein GF312_13780 [Candidatus Poribacteria bacterium]|nr:hypothetical protein [Candidatus Poribacteria bacterium]